MFPKKEIHNLIMLDDLNHDEFLAGEEVFHDGVEITVPGNDLEVFLGPSGSEHGDDDTEDGDGLTEPGEISDSNEDLQHVVQLKVVKVTKKNKLPTIPKRSDKFAHLRHDPDFKDFLNEILDERMSVKAPESADRTRRLPESADHSAERIRPSSKSKTSKGIDADIEATPHKVLKLLVFKSPFDTTIYSPGLRHASNEDVSLIEKISNFVESIKLDSRRDRSHRSQQQ